MNLNRQNTALELPFSLFIVLILLAGMFVWILLPQVKEKLTLEQQLHVVQGKNLHLKNEYDRKYENRSAYEAEAAALAERLENPIDAGALQNWIRKYLKDAKVSGSESEGFAVETLQQSPMPYYDFLEQLDHAPWILQAVPSIKMRKAAKGKGIQIHFILRAARQTAVKRPLQK